MFRRVLSVLQFTVAAMLLLAPMLGGQQPKAASLRGVVLDSAGKAVSDAKVVLRGEGSQVSREATTDAAGSFAFTEVAMGAFTLTASSGTVRSESVAVTISVPGEQPPVSLVLGGSVAPGKASARQDATQAMQFADDPDFAIAGVSDWTAAGGHGSDASLRTSEALTRDAVKLKSDNSKTAAAVMPSGGGEHGESEEALCEAVAKDPEGFDANFRLGRFYLEAQRYKDAIPPLQTAYQANASRYDNEYDLALALKMAGEAAPAREHVQRLLARHPSADLHRMLGELDEKLGDPLSAVREFQQAASDDPSEDNYFAWGSELLIHRAIWQAKEVFDEGARLYPQSTRMLTARGAALFAGALYDQAAMDLCKASDLNPESAEPYLFLGKIAIAAPDPLPCVVAKLARFENLQPANALSNYYYAMALWKQQGQAGDAQVMERVKNMLARAVTLDPKCADGFLQLGNLSAGEKEWQQAIGFYLQAIETEPELSDAHYRLGVAYERTGEKSKAREQFQLHDEIAKEQAAEVQRQRVAVKQFLVVLPGQAASQQVR
ncbi:MAG TPA: tetratricopeptide repeat protein [Terracidiphilus sp.]|nr:tetratricopeptide repeat protein [Terracidiphilus sp.]